MNLFSIKSYQGRGGIANVAKVSFPLVGAFIGHGINLFTDRVMLANYSSNANPAGNAAAMALDE